MPTASPGQTGVFRPDSDRSGDHRRAGRVLPLLIGIVIFVPACFRLPPGVCSYDSGDLQTACATFGLAHPPGYAGYTAIGWVICRAAEPVMTPARAVSVACALSMTGALVLLLRACLAVGVPTWVAAGGVLLLSQHPWVWCNTVVPEVYAPGACLTIAALYLLIRDEQGGGWWRGAAAAALFGFAAAQRLSLMLIAPWLLAGWALATWRKKRSGRGRELTAGRFAGRAILVVLAGAVPTVLTAMLTWERLGPHVPYRCPVEMAEAQRSAGEESGFPQDRMSQVRWVMTGEMFARLRGADFFQMRSKLRWVLAQCGLRNDLIAAGVAVVSGWGMYVLWRRSRSAAIGVVGFVAGTLAFVLEYRVYDTAADLLTLILPGSLAFLGGASELGGRALNWVAPGARSWLRLAAVEACAVIAVCVVGGALMRHNHSTFHADTFLRAVRLNELPPGSVICAPWSQSRALWYGKLVDTPRADVDIIGTDAVEAWENVRRRAADRPVYFVNAQRTSGDTGSEIAPALVREGSPAAP
ncbi:MAG: DUF2723 domain-containing protein [Phycisphaerae bacterium]|nr:MAG: DUF2723 domain-containing protein [Phycisphaerae bacterium]